MGLYTPLAATSSIGGYIEGVWSLLVACCGTAITLATFSCGELKKIKTFTELAVLTAGTPPW